MNAPSSGLSAGMGGMGGGGGRPVNRIAGQSYNRSAGGVPQGLARPSLPATSSPAQPAVERVKRIGAKTFFFKGDRYVDADASKEQAEKPVEIEQFSKEYFDLIEKLGDQSKAYLAEESTLLVVLDGQAYLITPPKLESTDKEESKDPGPK